MQESFKIWIDRLGEGRVQKIEEIFDPSFFEIDEKELKFCFPVKAVGDAYLAEDHLVIRLKALTKATVACSICNQMVDVDLQVHDFYHVEPISGIRDAVFDFSVPLREALLLELPNYFECNNGQCPERSSLAPYLRRKEKENIQDVHLPFADLS